MSLVLVYNDILTDISKDELDGLSAQLLEMGQEAPVDAAIEDAYGTIELYMSPWLIRSDALKKIWRKLTIAGLYNRLSAIPQKRKDEQAWCIKILEGIRDGLFKNLVIDPDATTIPTGSWGSRSSVNTSALRGTTLIRNA